MKTNSGRDSITQQRLTTFLAERVLGWSEGPDRFLRGKRSWLPKWRFQPLVNFKDAFVLLEAAAPNTYRMDADATGEFRVRLEIKGCVGEARDRLIARAISIAIARALGISAEVDGPIQW